MCQGVIFYTPNLEVLLKVIHCETPRMTLSAVMPLRIFVPSVKKCETRRDLVSLWALQIHVYGRVQRSSTEQAKWQVKESWGYLPSGLQSLMAF